MALSFIRQEQLSRKLVIHLKDEGKINLSLDPNRDIVNWSRALAISIKEARKLRKWLGKKISKKMLN